MILSELQISNLRNISTLIEPLHPHFNIISGGNGSGKTSFLEAIYLLSNGHSFRTREHTPLIQFSAEAATVFAKSEDGQQISIRKNIQGETSARLNGKACLARSDLALSLPCQIVYQDIFQIIDAGSSVRRATINWGLFHVEPTYHALWKEYRRALQQRNQLLRQKAAQKEFRPWNALLSELATQIDTLRKAHCEHLHQAFQNILQQISDIGATFEYYKGWDKKKEGKSLEAVLEAAYVSDLHRQFTQYGAHQADLWILNKRIKVKPYLSRGQQKMILFALKLAQGALLEAKSIFLIDDLSSELDAEHISRLLQYLAGLDNQIVITLRENDSQWLAAMPGSHRHFSMHSRKESIVSRETL